MATLKVGETLKAMTTLMDFEFGISVAGIIRDLKPFRLEFPPSLRATAGNRKCATACLRLLNFLRGDVRSIAVIKHRRLYFSNLRF